MNFSATLNNNNWQSSAKSKKPKAVIKMISTRKNISAIVAILLGVLIVSYALSVKETPKTDVTVYSQLK